MLHHYYAYGLNIQSEIHFPELPPACGAVDVTIHFAGLPEPWDDLARGERFFRRSGGGVLLSWPRFARFLVRGGNEIICELAPGSSDDSVIRHLLMGPVLSILNYQRGVAIFHASAVALPAGGAAFMANAGHGKSTQAAAMVKRGFPLITDDLLLLKVAQQQVDVMPGVPYLKLWPPSLEMIGEDPASLPQVKINLEKRTLSMGSAFVSSPVPLKAVFILDLGESLEIRPLQKKEALRRIMPHWYGVLFQGELLPVLGLERHFIDCTAIVDRIPVYLLKRPVSLDLLPEICQAVECLV